MARKNGSSQLIERDTPRVTLGREWRRAREDGILIQFPYSGNIALIRPINTSTVIELGFIPDSLTPLANRIVSGQATPQEAANKMTIEDIKEQNRFVDRVVKFAFLDPQIVDEDEVPDNELSEHQIRIEDVAQVDKSWLMSLLDQPAASLQAFRPQQENDVEPVRDHDDNGAASKPDPQP